MILIIGGNSQGKLEFAQSLLNVQDTDITDGSCCPFADAFHRPVLNHLHLLIKRLRQEGLDHLSFVLEGIENNKNITVICDELSTGVIPIKREDREIQEQIGRLQCEIAQRAEKVYRVYCSIPVLIKGIENEL